jgi:uncharacterized membrane protein
MDVASLAQAKAMGVAGSILVFLSPVVALTALVPPVMFFSDILLSIAIISGVGGLLGFMLILVAVKRISDAVNDRAIFKDVLKTASPLYSACGLY